MQSSFSAHTDQDTDIVFSTLWIENYQCNVPRILENILGHPVLN